VSARHYDLGARLNALGVGQNASDLVENGYTVIQGAAPVEFFNSLRTRILECVAEAGALFQTGMLLARGRIFEEAVCNAKVLALAEFLCGRGFILNQVVGTVRPQGEGGLPIHTDYDMIREPFPPYAQVATAVWACDDFTEAGGATRVVPGSHRLRRHPIPDGGDCDARAIPIESSRGSILMWDGATWHGSCPRTAEGERVALHVMFNRMVLRSYESYRLPQEVIERNPPELAAMLGMNDPFGKNTELGVDVERAAWATRVFRT
jgi:hypothetical protein